MKPDSRRLDTPRPWGRSCMSSLAFAAWLHWGEAPVPPEQEPSAGSTIAANLPPSPLPGQTRPDATGRCPRRSHVPINGGCWKKLAVDLTDCTEEDYVYKGVCYMPALPLPRPSISSPAFSLETP
jgi:hypothetical protein